MANKLPAKFLDTANTRWQKAKTFSMNWRTEAREAYAFVSGKQWTDEDIAELEENDRPAVTFNYSEKMIDAVTGAEVSNRQEVRYFPREINDSQLAEVWSDVAKWARQECNAEDEDTDAFRDALICGMGWTETGMSYEEDIDGKVCVDRRDPLNMYWDGAATKPGVSDSRYVFHAEWMYDEDIRERWPGKTVNSIDATADPGIDVIDRSRRYADEDDEAHEMHKGQTQVLHYQCWYHQKVYRLVNPQSGQIVEMNPAEFKQIKDSAEYFNIEYVEQKKRVYYRAYIAGDTLLEGGESPCQCGFTFKCITGKRDRNKNTWYGLTRVMMDPQKWANKWLSQIMHIINSNAKGGLMAETGAFVDPRKAEEEWSSPNSVTLLNEGGLGKIKEKTMTQYPTGLDRLMEFALNSLPMVTGINLEALGLANREQAGVLEQQRKQAAYGLLAPIFDSLRRYRKEQGRVLLYYIQEYLADGRLIRIVGKDGARVIPLTKDKQAIRYDIIVDQAPDSPDAKTKTWETLTQLLPPMMKAGIPVPPDLFDYTPLPTALAQRWKEFSMNNPSMSPEQQKELSVKVGTLTEENMKLKMDKSVDMAEFQMKQQMNGQELQMKMQQLEQEFQLKQIQMEREFALKVKELEMKYALQTAEFENTMQLKNFEAQTSAALETQKVQEQNALRKEQVQGDLKVKALAAGVKADDEDGELSLKLDLGPLTQALEAMAQGNAMLAQSVAQAAQQNSEAVEQMISQLSAPKEVMFNQEGRPVGIRPARMN